ncbi:MAG: hypothetical protein ACI4NP_01595 [Thermoguttaceae bacterium]
MEDDAEGLGVKNFDCENKGDRSDELLNSEGLDSLETRRTSNLDSSDQNENLSEEDLEENRSVVSDVVDSDVRRAEKSLPKRTLRFIPKFVRAPRSRVDEGLILKRAIFREKSRDSNAISKSKISEKIGLQSLIATPGIGYQLLDSFPQLVFSLSSTSPTLKDSVVCCSATDRGEWDVDFYQESSRVSAWGDVREVCDLSFDTPSFQAQKSKSKVFSLARGTLDNLCLNASTGACELSLASSFCYFVAGALPVGASALSLRPYEYYRGASRSLVPYPFAELGENENAGILPTATAVLGASNAPRALTRDEVLEEISAVYGQNERILLLVSNTYLAVDGSDDEEVSPALSAEDLRLAELLGRLPNAFELSEYYWEPVNESEKDAAPSNDPSILSRLFYDMSVPPVFVGRLAIHAFQKLFLVDVSRSDSLKATRGSSEVKTQHKAIDVAVPMVAGIALAVCVVFPALKYVVEEIFTTVIESKVRKIDGNVTFSSVDSELDVIPLISEQILFPRYEAVEFDVGADGASSMENDGYPVIMQGR